MTDSTRRRPHPGINAGNVLPIIGALASTSLVGASLLAAYSLAIEPYRLDFTHPVVPIPNLPPVLDGLSILLLADSHVADWGRREEIFLALLENAPQPDLVIWAGDFIQGKLGIPNALRLCQAVAARYPGVPNFGVIGNAEHKMRLEYRLRFVEQLRCIGIRMLINSWESLTIKNEEIMICGVDDPYYGHSDLELAMQDAPRDDRFRMLLAHSPQIATQAARAGFNLMLSGHTHGGQVRFPLIGPVKTQNPLSRALDCGLFDTAKLRQAIGRDPGGSLVTYISRGIGVALVPRMPWLAPRFLCRPEVALLALRRASTEA